MGWTEKFGDPTEADLKLIRAVECVEKNGEVYFRINPEDIDLTKMAQVQKGTDVIAIQVKEGEVKVTTHHNDADYSVTKTAHAGDYIVFNIGASDEEKLIDKIEDCDKKILSLEEFEHLYSSAGEGVEFSSIEMEMLMASLTADSLDNPNLNRSFFRDPMRHAYIGKMVYAAMVNFNFILRAPWGSDQFIKKGGVIIYNPNSSKNNGKDIYAMGGVKEGRAGQFEKTYKLAEGEGKSRGLITDTFKNIIKCDRSPVVGIQFNNIQVAEAFDKIGKAVPANLRKYLDPKEAVSEVNKPKSQKQPKPHKDKTHKEKVKESKSNTGQDKGFST